MSTAAMAADLPPIAAPVIAPVPVATTDCCNGWYLRGDVGFATADFKSLTNPAQNPALNPGIFNVLPVGEGFEAAPIFGFGIGYKWNEWLRFDGTAQWRGFATFHGSDNTSFNNGGTTGFGSDNYTVRKSEFLVMANAYIDLGTWWCVTPFIGAGIGAARIDLRGFRDDGIATLFPPGSGVGPGTTYFADNAQWNTAWAIHAGLAYKVTPGFTVELAYHYVNFGSAQTGLPRNFDNSPILPAVANAPFTFNTLTSQDVTLGMRWQFETPPAPVGGPLMRRG